MSRRLAVLLPLLAGLCCSACSGQDQLGSTQQKLSSWVTSSGFGPGVGQLQVDAAHVSTAVAERANRQVIQTVCAILLTDAESANSNLPSPDGQLTALAAAGYNALGAGANHCYASGGTNVTLLAQSATERAQGLIDLAKATDRAEQVLGQPVSTTTTTEAPSAG